jgi:hypothetical protein
LHEHAAAPAALLLLSGHDVHDADAAVAENVLGAHGAHRRFAHTEPAAHVEQLAHGVVVVTPVAEKKPREQTHWVAPASLLLPLGHDVHVADADVVEKVLAAHVVQTPAEHCEPAGHDAHEVQGVLVAVPSAE